MIQPKLRVLFVDDEQAIRDVMQIEIPRMGHDLTICEDGDKALQELKKQSFDVAVIDLRMPGIDGWEVVEFLKANSPETEFIISTGHGNMDEAIRAVREGAFDFLQKPCKLFEIANVFKKISERQALSNRAEALETSLKAVRGSSSDFIGESPSMKRVKSLVEKIAPTISTVLIQGETGTGKELVARRIHDFGDRATGPFVPVNCGALPENLVESELFGHRKGAFTGADVSRKGLIEVANGGTLFLDELGELDKTMQVKLLRFLESGEIRRVGENESFHVDVRVVCATNCNLQEMVDHGSFRQDLYFRVNTFEITLPPLRERREDIPAIARFLIARYLHRASVEEEFLSPQALAILMNYEWKGNVRELANALEHAVILCEGEQIRPEDLPALLSQSLPGLNGSLGGDFTNGGRPRSLRDIEMHVILDTLSFNQGDKPKTASDLGVSLKTLYNKLNQYQTHKAAG